MDVAAQPANGVGNHNAEAARAAPEAPALSAAVPSLVQTPRVTRGAANPWKKRLLVLAAGAAAALLGVGMAWRVRSAESVDKTGYETASASRGDVEAHVTATGILSALVTVQVGSQVSGRVQKLHVDFNSTVTAGQLIAELDPRYFKAQRAQAHANVNAARGNLAKARAALTDARRQLTRARTLRSQQVFSAVELETADTLHSSALASVKAEQGGLEQAQASLNQANINLQYTRIVSPTNGTVISRNVDVGQTVAASLQAPILFVIAEDLRKMQVDTSVAEADVGRLQAGMPSSFTVDAYGATVFPGTVRQVRNAPQILQNVVTYDAVIDVDNPGLKLKPGMTANVTFIYGRKANVLMVPNAALRFRAPGSWVSHSATKAPADRRLVWVLRNHERVPLSIRTGISDGTSTEVVDGALQDHDLLITDAADPAKGAAPAAIRRSL